MRALTRMVFWGVLCIEATVRVRTPNDPTLAVFDLAASIVCSGFFFWAAWDARIFSWRAEPSRAWRDGT